VDVCAEMCVKPLVCPTLSPLISVKPLVCPTLSPLINCNMFCDWLSFMQMLPFVAWCLDVTGTEGVVFGWDNAG